jgi:hypothetical protein
LALDLYRRYGIADDHHPEVVQLSDLLNRLPIHTSRPVEEKFRNANGVALKLANFASVDPDYGGVGMTRGGRLDREVWNEFAGHWDELEAAAADIRASVGADPGVAPPTEVQEAREDVAQLAGRPRRQGQVRSLSPQARAAVEAHAMARVERHYREAGWDVKDVSKSQPFDFLCTRNDVELCVEVKGTTAPEGNTVLLTPGEVRHVKSRHPHTALVVIYGIELAERADGTFDASGGQQRVLEPWNVELGTLTPLGFEYKLPSVRTSVMTNGSSRAAAQP